MLRRSGGGLALGAMTAAWLWAGSAAAGTIVDTGTPLYDWFGYSLGLSDWHAVEFTVAESYTLTGIQSFIVETAGEGAGDFTIALYGDGGDAPGSQLYAASVSYTADGWQGLSGLSWNVGPGSYWVAFEVRDGQTLSAMLPYPTPGPSGAQAYRNAWSAGYVADEWLEDFGLRVYGDVRVPDPSVAPEPGAWALMILGFGGAGAALRRRTATA